MGISGQPAKQLAFDTSAHGGTQCVAWARSADNDAYRLITVGQDGRIAERDFEHPQTINRQQEPSPQDRKSLRIVACDNVGKLVATASDMRVEVRA